MIIGWLSGLVAALLWSGLDAARKSLSQHLSATALVTWLSLGPLPIFAVWALIDGGPNDFVAYAPLAVAGIVLNTTANLFFVRAVQQSPLSLTIPFLSFSPIFSAVAGAVLLGEALLATQIVGIVATVGGAFVLLLRGTSLRRLVSAARQERGPVLMTSTAALWAATSAVDKMALDHVTLPAHASVQAVGVGSLLIATLAARGRMRELAVGPRRRALLVGAVILATSALSFQLLSLTFLKVAVMETIKRSVGMTMSVVMGRLVFTEPISLRKVIAVAIMAAGTSLVLLAP